MKTNKLEIVKYIVEQNFYKSDNQKFLQENNNVNFEKKEFKRFKQYF
jgi:hypothetical protein